MKILDTLDRRGETEVVLYSDTCGAQNRNCVLGTAILHFLSRARNVQSVDQKFFESGHSHMECDSMHSAIESSCQKVELDLPSDYHQCMEQARRGKPYVISELTHEDIVDYKAFNARHFSSTAFSGIIKVHHIRYQSNSGRPSATMSNEIDGTMADVRYCKRGGQVNLAQKPADAYQSPPGVDKQKKSDLLSLIPHLKSKAMGRLFYSSLAESN